MAQHGDDGLLAAETSEGDLSRDEIFELISNPRRRHAIRYCKMQDGPVQLADLAEQVAAWEHDKEIADVTSSERKTVYTSLQQTHLPRLDRANVIDFENGTVELTDQIRQLNIYLDIVPEGSISWGVYYLGLSLLSIVVLAALWLDFLPTDPPSVLVYPTAVVVVFAVSAVYHTYLNHRYRFEEFERP
ncbi:DUF7344 domain-containing protein [Halobaculum roseum]|uniref:DUF7344 domain-containing protein n=1 Tax=Halobaculum roseum TaxID=2175149 RepID=A0ABD5MKM9_9EURY|nr:hypothetical protein [Halobaculum roseum]QZY03126.1 hypothetical protein K6T36_02750 [Halobaculum roseum]